MTIIRYAAIRCGLLAAACVSGLLLSACGGGGGSGNPAAPPTPAPTPAPTPPPAAFGPGQHLVNTSTGIPSGRYFADPSRSGCYWKRLSGLGGTIGEIISNDFVGFDAMQIIVDILGSDLAFEAESECGSWYTSRRHPAQTNIAPGVWLVGNQIAAGTYQANAGAGCYWARLRNFESGVGSIIANDFIPDAGSRLVSISADDVGFYNDGDCGTWTPSTSAAPVTAQSQGDIERAWRQAREKHGLR